MPVCFQPENLRGRPINRLKRANLEFCFGRFDDEDINSPITARKFHQGQFNMLAVMGASIFVLLLLIIIVSLSICTRQRAHYYTREDGKGGERIDFLPSASSSSRIKFDLTLFLSLDIFLTFLAFCFTFPESGSEKILEGSLITGTEINFKFPLDDRSICTIDEICLPPPPPPPAFRAMSAARTSS